MNNIPTIIEMNDIIDELKTMKNPVSPVINELEYYLGIMDNSQIHISIQYYANGQPTIIDLNPTWLTFVRSTHLEFAATPIMAIKHIQAWVTEVENEKLQNNQNTLILKAILWVKQLINNDGLAHDNEIMQAIADLDPENAHNDVNYRNPTHPDIIDYYHDICDKYALFYGGDNDYQQAYQDVTETVPSNSNEYRAYLNGEQKLDAMVHHLKVKGANHKDVLVSLDNDEEFYNPKLLTINDMYEIVEDEGI